MSVLARRLLAAGAALVLSLVLGALALAAAMPVHVQHKLAVRQNVHLTLHAGQLPEGGYYYGVIVLKPYKGYTRASPPPCSVSSNMQRTDYGYPQANRQVALALTPAHSPTGHWCPSGSYEGAIYAVPHTPPCESAYPCQSEPYERLGRCAHTGVPCPAGIVARGYAYPDGLPTPLATGTTIVAHFSVKFPRWPSPHVQFASAHAEFERDGRAIEKGLKACRAKHRIILLEDGSARCVKP